MSLGDPEVQAEEREHSDVRLIAESGERTEKIRPQEVLTGNEEAVKEKTGADCSVEVPTATKSWLYLHLMHKDSRRQTVEEKPGELIPSRRIVLL